MEKRYDELEEELHDLEDALMETHGEEMENVIQDVHDRICPDTDVLLPIAYLAKAYVPAQSEDGKDTYEVHFESATVVQLGSTVGVALSRPG